MQRLEEMYGESEEFSQQRLIDEDASMKEELKKMRNGLIRRRSTSSTISRSSQSSLSQNNSCSLLGPPNKRQKSNGSVRPGNGSMSFSQRTTGSLSIALQASRKSHRKSSFLGGANASEVGKEICSAYKAVALGHVVFNSQSSRSGFGGGDMRGGPSAEASGV